MITLSKAVETPTGVTIKTRDEEGKSIVEEVEFQNYFYVTSETFFKLKNVLAKYCSNANEYEAKNGSFIKVYLRDNTQRPYIKKIIENMGHKTYEADINANKRYVIDNAMKYNFSNVKLLYFDLETDDRGSFDKDEMGYVIPGKKQILSCSLMDEQENKWWFFNENPDNPQALEEKKMLSDIFSIMKQYDVVTAWNGKFFDDEYIKKRLEATGHQECIEINETLCRVDMKELLQKYTFDKHDSYSLENIANDILGDGKIKFNDEESAGNGKFYRLFMTNRTKFKEYNMKDVELMHKINNKLKLFATHKMKAEITKSTLDDAVLTSKFADNALLRRCHDRNIVCDSKPTKDELAQLESLHVGGGFVMVVPGHRDNVQSFDFKSHYPLVAMTFNISKETFVTAVNFDMTEIAENISFTRNELHVLWTIYDKSKSTKEIDALIEEYKINWTELMFKVTNAYRGTRIKEYADKNGYIWTPADLNKDTDGYNFHPHRLYTKDFGTLPEYVYDAVTNRDKVKYEKERKVSEDKSFEKTDEYKQLDLADKAFKLIGNGAYGFTGLKSSRFFDYHVADAITTVGRWIIKKAILFSETLGYKVVQVDTDSVYLEPFNCQLTADETDYEYHNYFATELFKPFNPVKMFSFKNPKTGELEEHGYYCIFEQDKFFQSMISVARKRYYYIEDDKVKTQGGAFKKRDTNLLAAKLQKDLARDILTHSFLDTKWVPILNDMKVKTFDQKLEQEYLIFKKGYSKHYSAFGQSMIDKVTGEQKKTADGKPRFAPVPCHIELVKRLESEYKIETIVGDVIKYIVAEPAVIDFKCASRKKVDREEFNKLLISLKAFPPIAKINYFEEHAIDYIPMYTTRQYAITPEEYAEGARYDAKMYFERIITPLIELLWVVFPQKMATTYAEVFNLTPKEIESLLKEEIVDEEDEITEE